MRGGQAVSALTRGRLGSADGSEENGSGGGGGTPSTAERHSASAQEALEAPVLAAVNAERARNGEAPVGRLTVQHLKVLAALVQRTGHPGRQNRCILLGRMRAQRGRSVGSVLGHQLGLAGSKAARLTCAGAPAREEHRAAALARGQQEA